MNMIAVGPRTLKQKPLLTISKHDTLPVVREPGNKPLLLISKHDMLPEVQEPGHDFKTCFLWVQ